MFKKAERRQVKLKIALAGPSGSGKTLSALLIAKGIGQKIALIDTENESASLYAGMKLPSGELVPEFDTLNLQPPFTVDKYVAAINAAVAAKYDVLVVDSLSHQWAGEGGILSKKEQLDARGGNSYAHWAKLTPEHEKFKAAILHSDIHIIGTLRSKQEYALTGGEGGRSLSVQKLGMAPIQRDGMEYEFTVFFDLDMKHQAQASKDRTSLFDGRALFVPSPKTGEELMRWLLGAQPASAPAPTIAMVSEPAPTTPMVSAPRNPLEKPPAAQTGAFCEGCKAELVAHSSGAGVICPNAKKKGDGHTRVANENLALFKSKQHAQVAQAAQ